MTDTRTCAICGCRPERDERGVVHWYHQRPECGAALQQIAMAADDERGRSWALHCRQCTRCQRAPARARGESSYATCSADDDDPAEVVCCWCGRMVRHWVAVDMRGLQAALEALPADDLTRQAVAARWTMPTHCAHLRST